MKRRMWGHPVISPVRIKTEDKKFININMINNGIRFLTRGTPQFCQNLERRVSASLSLLDRTVDLVICLNALHHLEDSVPSFHEAARLLKKKGKSVIMDFCRDVPKALAIFVNLLWRLIMRGERARDSLGNSLRAFFTLEECEELLRRSNLPAWRIYSRVVERWTESY